jgi:hypothetical protein
MPHVVSRSALASRSLPSAVLAAGLGLLSACSGGGSTAACADAESLAPGVVTADVDGAAWESTATWTWAGESLQIDTAPADGWSFTVVAQTTSSGDTLKAAADAGDFPVDVVLEDDQGGWGRGHPTEGDPYITDAAAGGTFTLSGLDGADLFGCFGFVAATDAGDSVTVDAGAIRAASL